MINKENQSNGNTQLNQIRNEFNHRVNNKSYMGQGKRVTWNGSRRFRTI